MAEGEQLTQHPSHTEMVSLHTKGRAREFRGDVLEGIRADELNKATEYAFSLGDLDEDSRRTMDHLATLAWLSANDLQSGNVTRVIYDETDPQQIILGHITLVTDFDVAKRSQRVKTLASAHGVSVTESTIMIEMNFDVPWHEGDEYISLAQGAVAETLQEVFQADPNSCVYMYVNKENYYPDGVVLKKLGATRVGKDTYLNSPETRADRWKDSVYVVDRASFEAALQ